MALTPAEDKAAFWERIRRDKWIDSRMAITGLSDADAAVYIRKQRTVDDKELNSSSRFILIFDVQSNDAGQLYEQSCIQVDVLVAASKQSNADMLLTQIIALCGEGWQVNGRTIARVVRVGELTAAAGYYRCGCRFFYYACTKNQIQKI